MVHKITILAMSVFILIATITSSQSQSSHHSIQIILDINNTDNTVFIPGDGTYSSSSISSTITRENMPDYYLASYLNNKLIALVFSQENPIEMSVSKTTGHHFLTLSQNLTNSQAFLAFTQGDYITVRNRMDTIETGTFLSEISPSFYYPLGTKNKIKLKLKYTDIDLKGNFTFRQGVHKVTLESNKTGNTKVIIINETIG